MDSTSDIEKGLSNGTEYNGYPYFSYVQSFERSYDLDAVCRWLKAYSYLSLYISAAYLMVVFCLERYMRNRPPMTIRKGFLFWNAALAIFSILGMCRTISELAHVMKNYGIQTSVCVGNFNSVTGFWMSLFAFSKNIELFDTVFLVLRKRLTFLHLTHHVITLLICWNLMAYLPPLGRWTFSMNYTVHAFMYTYFALKASKIRIPEWVSFGLTCLQILQFILGFCAGSYCGYIKLSGIPCNTSMTVVVCSHLVNGYFFIIFGKFAVNRYFRSNKKNKDV